MAWMILTWSIFGLLVGLVARLLVPGRQPLGIFGTMALGIAGSFVGGMLANLVFGVSVLAINPAGFVGSILGATLLLAFVQMLRR